MFWFHQIVDTLKREHICANAYKRQVFLNEKVIVDGHTALKFGVMTKENQGKLPTLYWLPKLHNKPIKQDLLPILVLVRQRNFLNCNVLSYRYQKQVIKYCEKSIWKIC